MPATKSPYAERNDPQCLAAIKPALSPERLLVAMQKVRIALYTGNARSAHEAIDEALEPDYKGPWLDWPVAVLRNYGVSQRTVNKLDENGVLYLRSIMARSPSALLEIRGIGDAAVEQICRAIERIKHEQDG